MNKALTVVLSVSVLLTWGAVMLADSPQDRTQQPGQPRSRPLP